MSFILTPEQGEDIQINAWNWRPTVELLRRAKLIDEELCDRMGNQGCAARVDADRACRIADFLDARLTKMNAGERIRYDLTTTNAPKKPAVFTPTSRVTDFDTVDLYSATYEWLIEFRDFCRSSGGFEIS